MAIISQMQPWRLALLLLGLAFFVVALVLEGVILFNDYSKTVTTDGAVVTTVTRGSPPSAGLVTGALGFGLVCLLVAAFWDRISKISVGGVDIEFKPSLAAKVGQATAVATRNAPEKYRQVYLQAAQLLLTGSVSTADAAPPGVRYAVDPETVAAENAVREAAVMADVP